MRFFQANDSRYCRYGRQFPIAGIGPIDLLTVDVESGDLIVIELKRDKPTRYIIGQFREYVGWVEEYLATDGQQVHGIICVWEHGRNSRVEVPELMIIPRRDGLVLSLGRL